MKYVFLTPEQYNKIYSDRTKILIHSNIDERLNLLKDENRKLREALEVASKAIGKNKCEEACSNARKVLESFIEKEKKLIKEIIKLNI